MGNPQRYSFDITFTGQGVDRAFAGSLVDVVHNVTYSWKSRRAAPETVQGLRVSAPTDQQTTSTTAIDPRLSISHLLSQSSQSREAYTDPAGNTRFEDLAQKEADKTFERVSLRTRLLHINLPQPSVPS